MERERKWNGNGTETERNWNRNGTEMVRERFGNERITVQDNSFLK